jgi:hypothetical protein
MNQNKTKTRNPGITHNKNNSSNTESSVGLALVMIGIVVLSLVLLKIETNRNMKPSNSEIEQAVGGNSISSSASTNNASGTATSVKDEVKDKADDATREQMKQILIAAKKVPFKARISTESGFKGFWTQNTLNYRFQNPLNSQVIIFNASKKRLWVVDLTNNIAFETRFNDQSVDAYAEFSPAMFLEVLSDSTDTATKSLEQILPSGDKAKLTFTAIGLPKRWEGQDSSGTATFIAWDYTQLADVPETDFELPAGIVVKSLTSGDINSNK